MGLCMFSPVPGRNPLWVDPCIDATSLESLLGIAQISVSPMLVTKSL